MMTITGDLSIESTKVSMTPLERLFTAVSHKEADRVPLFLFLGLQGSRELGLSIREYYSKAHYVAEGQLRLMKKYGSDCLAGFFHAPLEIEAWGGEVIYCDDGPPNSGAPFIRDFASIRSLEPPSVSGSPLLQEVLQSIRLMKAETGGSIPIIGVAMSPFSLPVMQMGFDRYLELMYEEPGLFRHLMEINEAFEVAWANAQLEAGAHVICYFDPVSSPTIIPPERYRDSGKVIATRTISRIKGPVVTHFASGRCLPVLDDVIETGTVALGVSSLEDLRELKNLAAGRLTLVGNLNGVEMRRWTPEQAEVAVRDAIACAGRGGGFILSDNHGEIPWLVPEEVLMAIAEASRKWGTYPLDWINEYEP